ncbi:MAG: heparan-alpha-glucosaminide N-acetyltransferase domain-containing protein [Chryseolinea sp.]
MKRLDSIDFTRGFVMIIMALDHTRDFLHITGLTQDPTDLTTTTPVLFFTRWITHLCAPTFVFLAGVSAYLYFKNEGLAKGRQFLLSRGIWLIIVEFTIVNFALWFDIEFHVLLFEVIGAIGFGFVVLGLILSVPVRTLGIIGLVIVFAHNAFPVIPFAEGSVLKTILTPLFARTALPISPNILFVMGYPPIPWLGIMLVGFASGMLFEFTELKRKSLLLKIGISSLVLFVLLRFINVYGDASWTSQKNSVFTFLSFLNVTKYPPSLLFALCMLGVTFLILYFSEGVKNKVMDVVMVYGKVPLFYFIVHLYLLHTLMIVIMFLQGFQWSELNFGAFGSGRPKEGESGVELWVVYLIWISVVVLLYPVCKWYGKYRADHKEKKWLKYF